jgi:hypothetical protein
MTSPIIVTNTPIILVTRNNSRDRLMLQNNGKRDVYVKRQPTNIITDIPSPTNYDFILYSQTGNEDPDITQINSVAAYAAVAALPSDKAPSSSSEVAVMQTIKTNIL